VNYLHTHTQKNTSKEWGRINNISFLDDVRALSTKNNTFVVILPFFLVLAVLRGHSICL